MKKITYTKKAMKDLAKMPANAQKNVRAKINQYATDPASLANNVIKMTGEPGYRLRVGDYRVRFDEYDTVIDIWRVLPRGQVYKK
ncbi:type II toxin-antitoxin system RelE family toxin [Rappaport israeli]|uniref:type II toxin-antitoxin system RelE family toxin n=1 Tax=Rappaport israeli TaxID=1839807 RepID=UPI00093087FF|nr:type II toxin-antitoxin system RelE/ParE family toxin [Rappaport israeli]